MAGPAPVELSADCPACGLEAGVAEIYDVLAPACRFGLPASTRCKLCGASHEGRLDRPPARSMRELPANRCPSCLVELGPEALDERRCNACGATATLVETAPAASLATEPALVAALDAWTAREQWPSRDALLGAVFCDPDVTSLLDRLARHERLEVIADPFANMGMRTTGRAPDDRKVSRERTGDRRQTTDNEQRPAERPLPSDVSIPDGLLPVACSPLPAAPAPAPALTKPPPSAPPRAIVYPLVSVVAADGEIHASERALVDRFLHGEGLAPLTDDELHVHHPSTVAHLIPKERREAVVQLMCETAAIDGMPDESERRVIRAYAAAWDVPDEKVEFWMWGYESMSTSLVRQLWMKLRRFVLSARWSDHDPT